MSDEVNHVNLAGARTEEQRKIMQQIVKDGVCPFCRENFETYHTKQILFETDYWVVTENAWPYENASYHFLFVAKVHITSPTKLSERAWQDLQHCITRLEHEHALKQGSLLMRFGRSEYTGGTVEHLHAQLVVGSSPEKPVMTRVG